MFEREMLFQVRSIHFNVFLFRGVGINAEEEKRRQNIDVKGQNLKAKTEKYWIF